ncbi:ATP adenylyltransferase [Prochlorococcus marinus]|uniref:ATP adenylyltransferase n=1 Tax=Prochlorococcus marinus TaxID=1219 RepID=UPI0022B2CEB4|nr:ATP adenylyltransferase [Prochlorococcus marinus]
MTKGYYWEKAKIVTEQAVENSSLKPIKTIVSNIKINESNYFEFRKVISDSWKIKRIYGPKINPFKPWDKNLEVDLVGDNHILILNKYPVQLCHMLLITKEWQPQNGWLSYQDWKAFKIVDNDTNGLWFFNSCSESGASQPHRHIQLLPRNNKMKICPLEDSYNNLKNQKLFNNKILDNILIIYRDQNKESSQDIYEKYLYLCNKLGIGQPSSDSNPKLPYNLLISNKWIVIIRRSKEYINGFSINALGFAGYLLATNDSNIKWLNSNGPLNILENVV